MYWPTTSARRLHLSPSGLEEQVRSEEGDAAAEGSTSRQPQEILHIARSRNGHLWAAVSADTLSIWTSRPTQTIAALVRTPLSVEEYGKNAQVEWTEEGMGLVIETDRSYLLLYGISFPPDKESQIYSYVPSSGSGAKARATNEPLAPPLPSLKATFAAGSGEGTGAMARELRGISGTGGSQAAGEGKQAALEIHFKLVLRIDATLSCTAATREHLIVATRSPPAVQCIPWPDRKSNGDAQTRTSLIQRLNWIHFFGQRRGDEESEESLDDSVYATKILHSRAMDMYVWLTSDGRAYCAALDMHSKSSYWRGKCFHGAPRRRRASSSAAHHLAKTSADLSSAASEDAESEREFAIHSSGLPDGERAVCVSVNAKFSLIACGLQNGTVAIYTYRTPDKPALFSHSLSIRKALRSTATSLTTGACTSLAWTSDGHGLAVAWEHGWSVWSTYGKLMGCSLTENWQEVSSNFSDTFMMGVKEVFWGPGNTELFVLSSRGESAPLNADSQLFALPFAKSAVAGQHSPDNTRYAFIQLDDSVLVYRGSDQPDMSIINPESDVWHNIRIPQTYLAANWPIKYACISGDGRLIAVAGRRGITHFSSLSGRWKGYGTHAEEQDFSVRGGLQWFQHVLVVACHVHSTQTFELRLYSRDANLDNASILHRERLTSAVILTSLFDNSLLVYTADNTLYHYLIAITPYEIALTLCGSITFDGVVGEPARVRGMSWLIPPSQQRFGDPMDDLTVATVIFLIDGKLVLLRPRREHEDEEEVSYDMQILGDQIEYYWTHLQGVGTLENSLWGYDGHGIKLWLDALTIEQAHRREDDDEFGEEKEGDEEDDLDGRTSEEERPEYKTIQESVSMPLDFYPLCVLIEKGIVIGVEPEISMRRSLDFALFRSTTNTYLFLHNLLRHYLEKGQEREAVIFASFYTSIVYFAHALEILLHDVLEDEADALEEGATMSSMPSDGSIIEHRLTPSNSESSSIGGLAREADHEPPTSAKILPLVVSFLDHFDEALEVVVNCARKTEVARWNYLFSIVGDPKDLFEICLDAGNYKTAGSYLLVLHNLESLEASKEYTVRLLTLARQHGWINLCKDLLRFTRSLDDDGKALTEVVRRSGMLQHKLNDSSLLSPSGHRSVSSLHRTISAPNVLDSTPEEEEGDSMYDSPSRPSNGHRSASMFGAPPHHGAPPPVPHLTVNGRLLSPMRSNSSSSSGSGTISHGHHARKMSSGMGLSLSRVGLRSSDRLWDQSQ